MSYEEGIRAPEGEVQILDYTQLNSKKLLIAQVVPLKEKWLKRWVTKLAQSLRRIIQQTVKRRKSNWIS